MTEQQKLPEPSENLDFQSVRTAKCSEPQEYIVRDTYIPLPSFVPDARERGPTYGRVDPGMMDYRDVKLDGLMIGDSKDDGLKNLLWCIKQ